MSDLVSVEVCLLYMSKDGFLSVFVIVRSRDLSLLSLSSSSVKLRRGVMFFEEFRTASLSV